MKIGIVADTHDNLTKIKDMVEILNNHRVELVLHCGDFIAPFAVTLLEQLNCDWIGVFGNNDGEKKGLTKKSGGRIKRAPYLLELQGKKIAIMHEKKDIEADIIVFGHTHNPQIDEGEKLQVNPGEVGGWLTGKSSLAFLDLSCLKTEIIYF